MSELAVFVKPPKAAKSLDKKKALPKTVELKAWKTMTLTQCLKSIKTASHLSSKSVNTNARAVGVRIGGNKLALNFVSVSTLGGANVPLDYVTGALDAGPLKQITSVLDGSAKTLFVNVPEDQRAMIETLRSAVLTPELIGETVVDSRLRQVIWPTGDASAPWVALTPLQSTGLSDVIRGRLINESRVNINPETEKSTVFRSNAIFGIGGANKQNVGRYAFSMNRPLVFAAPTEDAEVRQAYAFHFKGHLNGRAFSAPTQQTHDFAVWHRDLKLSNGGQVKSNLEMRDTERKHIELIALAALSAAESARCALVKHREFFGELTSPALDPFLRALIDKDLRTREFKREFAQKLIRSIERFVLKIGNEKFIVAGDGDLGSLVAIAEGVVS